MTTPKKTALTPAEKPSLTIRAKDTAALKLNAELANEGMTPSVHNRRVTDAHMEIILARISGGDTLKSVCLELGISSNLVREFVRTHPDEYHRKWTIAKEDYAHAIVDTLLEVAWNDQETSDRSKVKIDAIKWIAERYNRDAYSPRQQVDVRQQIQFVLPPDADLY